MKERASTHESKSKVWNCQILWAVCVTFIALKATPCPLGRPGITRGTSQCTAAPHMDSQSVSAFIVSRWWRNSTTKQVKILELQNMLKMSFKANLSGGACVRLCGGGKGKEIAWVQKHGPFKLICRCLSISTCPVSLTTSVVTALGTHWMYLQVPIWVQFLTSHKIEQKKKENRQRTLHF